MNQPAIVFSAERAVRGEVSRQPPDVSHGRTGFQTNFLGRGHTVPFPRVPAPLRTLIAPVRGRRDGRLHYTHFSIVMRLDRQMPFFTACNIDGTRLFALVRGVDHWFFDDRVARAAQIGPDVYAGNPLDRGHLVRRLDPAWGRTKAEAEQGEGDTFFFTNCTPQHAILNEQTWYSLEEYILSNAATHQLKVCVFAGPVMSDTDRPYRGIRLPEEFWKVAVVVNNETNALSATGYILSQADYIGNMRFEYGVFRTYAVPLATIEEQTGLRFHLASHEPFVRGAAAIRVIRGPLDVVL